jgi:predicted transcriptional regulator
MEPKEQNVNETNSKIENVEVEQILRLLSCSDLRNNLAQALRNGKKMTLSELSEHVGASSPACVHALRELTKEHITSQDEKHNYLLTNIGEIITRKFEEINVSITALSQNREFWLNHDLSAIPKHLLDKISCLADSSVLSSTPTDLFKTFSTFYTLLGNAKEIRGFSPFFIEDLTNQFLKLVAKGIDIELIFTPDVLDATLRAAPRKELEEALKENLKIFKLEPQLNFASTVTDYFLSLAFFKPHETFDWSNMLLSYSPEALQWGQELFAYYVEKAEPVIL